MLVDHILGNLNEMHTEKTIVEVNFEWFELEKKRIKKTAADGEELGIVLTSPLKAGDILAETESRIYAVKLLPARLLKVKVGTMEEMGRACFELGNRHLSPKITADSVEVIYDEPTYLYMSRLGFEVEQVTEEFFGYIVCRAHGHEHSHGEAHHEEHHHEA